MLHFFPIAFLLLLHFFCLFEPALSAEECPYCLGNLDDQTNGAVIELDFKCKHKMHKSCLIQDIEKNKKMRCILCNKEIPTESLQEILNRRIEESDAAFLDFVKKEMSNKYQHSKLDKNELEKIRLSIVYENSHIFESHLGILLLMRKNWNCAKIEKELEKECQKYRNYVHLMYEYLFHVFLEGEMDQQEFAQQFPALKFRFTEGIGRRPNFKTLIDAVNCLSEISDFLYSNTRKKHQDNLEELFSYWPEPILENQDKLEEKYGLKKGGEGTSKCQSQTDKQQKEGETKGQQKTEKGTKGQIIEKLKHLFVKENQPQREKFDNLMEKMEKIAKALTSENRFLMTLHLYPSKRIWFSSFFNWKK